MLRKVWQTS